MEKKTAETRIDAVQLISRATARKSGYMVWIHQDHQWISYGSCGHDKDRAMAYAETICRENGLSQYQYLAENRYGETTTENIMVGKTAEPEAAPEPETQPEADPAPKKNKSRLAMIREQYAREAIRGMGAAYLASRAAASEAAPETPAEPQPESEAQPETAAPDQPEPEAKPETPPEAESAEPETPPETETQPDTVVFQKQGDYTMKQRFADMKFLTKAVSTDKTRPNMQVIHAQMRDDTLLLVSTDGRRLHTLAYTREPPLLSEPGDYKVIENKANTIVLQRIPEKDAPKFPEWETVMPPKPRKIFLDLGFGKGEFDKSVYKLNNIGTLFNSEYLKSFDIDGVRWTAYKDPDKEPILFESFGIAGTKVRQALIMPMLGNHEADQAIVSAQETLSESDLISLADFPPMQEDEYATVSVSYLPGPDGFNETENYEENLEAGIEEAETIHTALADKPVLPP